MTKLCNWISGRTVQTCWIWEFEFPHFHTWTAGDPALISSATQWLQPGISSDLPHRVTPCVQPLDRWRSRIDLVSTTCTTTGNCFQLCHCVSNRANWKPMTSKVNMQGCMNTWFGVPDTTKHCGDDPLMSLYLHHSLEPCGPPLERAPGVKAWAHLRRGNKVTNANENTIGGTL